MSKQLVAILVVLAGEWTASAAPHQPRVRALLLPTRRADAAELRDRVTRIARLLAPQAGAVAIEDDGSDETGNILLRAQRLAAAGALDDAAAVFDAALEATTRAPHHAADPAALVAAHVARASIALARGEPGRADELLERLVRWDGSFALLPGEDRPHLHRTVEEVRQRLGAHPDLRASDLGTSCPGERTILIVARALPDERSELVRFDECAQTAATPVRANATDAELASALVLPSERRALTLVAATPATADHAIAPAAVTLTPAEPSRPLYRKTWFWTVLGVVAAGSAAAVWATQRQGTEDVHVVPHL